MTYREILNLETGVEDISGANLTIRGYFKLLLTTLWSEGESFSGKRPFGDSGWEYELYKPLMQAGLVEGAIDEYGDIEECDDVAAHKLTLQLIGAL